MDVILGCNIKRARRELALSLSDLAAALRVTPSFLSQIETGKVSPSLARLKQIADALNVTIGELVGETGRREKIVVRRNDAISMPPMSEGVEVALLSSKNSHHFMQPYRITFKPGASTGDFNSHFGQECGFVLKGEVELHVGEERFRLEEGDHFYYNAGTPHRFVNVLDEVSCVYIITHPPIF